MERTVRLMATQKLIIKTVNSIKGTIPKTVNGQLWRDLQLYTLFFCLKCYLDGNLGVGASAEIEFNYVIYRTYWVIQWDLAKQE